MSQLFSPLTINGVTFKNRLGVSPMCQYQAVDGLVQDWHNQHLLSRAVGGAGCIIMEATAVEPEGRITAGCVGLWNDAQQEALAPLAASMKAYGAVPGIQIAHAGRKASAARPWDGGDHLPDQTGDPEGGWPTVSPSNLPFDPDGNRLWKEPSAMSLEQIEEMQTKFVASALRALEAGFELVELHGAHGYLLHSFLSPISNTRNDGYGGDLKGRARMMIETTEKVRAVWPEHLVLAVRISATDWHPDGITVEDSIQVAQWLKQAGADIVDVSSGGSSPRSRNSMREKGAEQPEMAGRIRNEAGIATMAVGEITTAARAEQIASDGLADLVLVAREFLRNPYLTYQFARELGVDTKGIMPNPNDFFVG